MKIDLPIHPSMRHPLTGHPLRALHVDKHGRARYPIMGAAPDDEADAAAKDAANAAAAESKAAEDAAAAKAAEDAKAAEADAPTGFPANTPRAQMKPAEQIAYDAHHGRKHEQRATEYREAAGGKTAAEVKADLAELATLRTAQMSDGEKAVDTARAEGRREASLALAPQMFDVALAHVDENRRNVLIENIDLTKVLKEDGTVDTAKVQAIANSLAPADKGSGSNNEKHDFGAGRRGGGSKSGVNAGADLFNASRTKSTAS